MICSRGRCWTLPTPVPPCRPTARSAASSSRVQSWSESWISAARMFSSRCETDDVPGITSMAGERASSQASAIW